MAKHKGDPGRTPLDKLSVIVFSGDFEKVHYALALAASAAAIGTPTTLFFTMQACRALTEPDASGTAAWRGLPAQGGSDGGTVDDLFAERGVATFEELLSACVELEVRFLVCEMGLRAFGFAPQALRRDLPLEPAGIVTFLDDASANGSMLFI